ncbi:MAG: protein phosphatase CheZ [Burkholderiales bacterium]
MNMNDLSSWNTPASEISACIEPAQARPAEPADLAYQASAAITPADVYHQLGLITRQLHDTLMQLGVMPKLQVAAQGLPDARSRLSYIAKKTGEAADKVLNSVDRAKQEHVHINNETRGIAEALMSNPVKAVASGALINFVSEVEAATARVDQHLTDIMMAQDFHDLTGQVVAKVVGLATDLEDSLVSLLVQAAPAEITQKIDLQGPVVTEGRTDVVNNQGEVDDLLASLGF